MLNLNYRKVKTSVLAILVVVSFGLSYLLWNGNWRNATEAGFATTNALPAADFPRSIEVAAPYQIILTTAKPARASVMASSGSAFAEWLSELSSVHLKDFHSVNQLPVQTNAKIEFDFSTLLNRVSLLKWVPNLSTTVLPIDARIISLYTLNATGPVYVSIAGDTGMYIGQTDLEPSNFNHSVSEAASDNPWVPWDGKNGDYVPAGKFKMDKLSFVISNRSVLPLVHSFFVNPQILTRIQENQGTVLWTDGSRAVQWDKEKQLLVFEDPNFNSQSVYQQSDLDSATTFIRNHGGTPENTIVFQADSSSMPDGANTYEFVPVLGGYPAYGTQFSNEIEVYQGHVVRYACPLIEFSKQVSAVHESLLSPNSVRSIVEHIFGKQSLSGIDIKLGYYPEVKSGTAVFIPSFYLYKNGNLTLIFDASTGEIMSKGGQS